MMLFKKYSELLIKYPLRTKMATASVIFSAADIVCQKYVEEKEKIDLKRTINNTIVGTFVQAPLLHLWMNVILFKGLNVVLPRLGLLVNASNSKKAILSVVLDQILFSPISQFSYYMSTNIIQHQNIEAGLNAVKSKMPKSLVDSYKIWPASNFICYSYVPLQFRVLWSNLVGIGWQIYMSYLNNNHHHHHSHENLFMSKQNSTVTIRNQTQINNQNQILPLS